MSSVERLTDLQQRIRAWSFKNFGNQRAKHGQLQGNDLHCIAPLLGMCEEMGELQLALIKKNRDGVIDAIGDVGIYLLDYAGRANVAIERVCIYLTDPAVFIEFKDTAAPALLALGISALQRAHLKQAQGIRGHDCQATFEAAQIAALARIVCGLYGMASDFNTDFVTLISGVAETVLARDWTKNPQTAQA